MSLRPIMGTRTETFTGPTLADTVASDGESLPGPLPSPPCAEGGRCQAGPRDLPTPIPTLAEPPARTVRPTNARSTGSSRADDSNTVATGLHRHRYANACEQVESVIEWFEVHAMPTTRRVRRALARAHLRDIGCDDDRGALARISYEFDRFKGRRKAGLDAYAADLGDLEFTIPPDRPGAA
jgi:hypothetical protein